MIRMLMTPAILSMTALTMPSVAIAQAPTVVFEGTVIKTHAVTLRTLRASDKTIVVRVDRIVQKPDSIPLADGEQLTVEMITANAAKEGERRTFRTAGWLYGDTLAVREVPEPAMRAAFEHRLETADTVVTGKVTALKEGIRDRPSKVSEHNPTVWREAIVRVTSGIKGTPSQDIVVRLPVSADVRWRDMPHVEIGEAFTFLLNKDTSSRARGSVLHGIRLQSYMITSSRDILTGDQSQAIKSAMSSAKR